MSAGSIGQQIINGTYGLDNRPPTAYEELKAWCEKHLAPLEWDDTLMSGRYHGAQDAIIIKGLVFIFKDDGSFDIFDRDD